MNVSIREKGLLLTLKHKPTRNGGSMTINELLEYGYEPHTIDKLVTSLKCKDLATITTSLHMHDAVQCQATYTLMVHLTAKGWTWLDDRANAIIAEHKRATQAYNDLMFELEQA